MNNNHSILKEGDTGDEVVLFQRLLKINNAFPGSITGVFGPDTVNWLLEFQIDNYLEATGTASKETWDLLYSITTPASKEKSVLNKPILEVGFVGEEVKEVQSILKNLLYYNGNIDGIYDEEVYDAVSSFQYINKLVPDGIVGPDTWSALIDLYAPLVDCGELPEEPDISDETYTVKTGDTLYSISREFNISVDELKRLNNLYSDTLSIGQVLFVKEVTTDEPDVNEETYTVKSGDTLYSIANKYGLTVNELKSLNNLTSDVLSIGQVLKVKNVDSTLPDVNEETYIVKVGDTLYSIANKFNMSVNDLKLLNNLVTDVLSIGQVLKVKGSVNEEPDVNEETYIVKSGDTLYSIASKFNMSVDELKAINNLTSNVLSIGQVLRIKGNSEPSITYTVKKGDTLYSIARAYDTTVDNIIKKNNLNSSVLSIGQILLI